MQKKLFYRMGAFIHRHPLAIIACWILVIACCVPFLPNLMNSFKSTGFTANNSPSLKADQYIEQHTNISNDSIIIFFQSASLKATDPAFQHKIKHALAKLEQFPAPHLMIYPQDNSKQIAKDGHSAYVVVLFDKSVHWDHDMVQKFRASIHAPEHMRMYLGGSPIIIEDVTEQTQKDLYQADIIGIPTAIITLLIIFGTVVAAMIPLLLGSGCALLILTTLYFLGQMFTLSIFTINIALLLGLCLSLDYSLFIIYRFRTELQQAPHLCDAVATTLATAGKAVFFSGLAVFVSLSALLIFPINILFSIGVGGLVAVFMAVALATTLLPAILVLLRNKINAWPIRLPKKKQQVFFFWRWLANIVVKHRLLCFFSMMLFLLLLGSPILKVKLGVSDVHILPKQTASRKFFSAFEAQFGENQLTPLRLLVKSKDDILNQRNLQNLYHLTDKLLHNSKIAEIDSIVNTSPRLTVKQYHELYQSSHQPDGVQTLLRSTTGKHFTVINIVANVGIHSSAMKTLIKELRTLQPPKDMQWVLTGIPVNDQDVIDSIVQLLPWAVFWILSLTYLTLMVLLRSLFLPLKAILMNLLSLSASYGMLVFIFQESHFHQILHFSPQSIIDISLLVIIFGALFGFSMDYEVFLLSRIKEAYDTCHDNNQSIVYGMEQSSRIITSAALIVIITCGSFMVADVLMVKEFGLGIAVAIFVDAFCIRTILVPATMSLFKQWNWYFPKWLNRCLGQA